MDPERWRRIEELYHSALAMKPDLRESYLDDLAGDPSLRREVERLLERQSEAEGFIDSPALELAAKALAADGDVAADSGISRTRSVPLPSPGEDRRGRHGRGLPVRATPASGATWRSRSWPQALTSDPDRRRRFEREARAVAALSHPNIVALYDVGTHDGAPFLVSELLEGRTLATRSAAGRCRLGRPSTSGSRSRKGSRRPTRSVSSTAI